MAKVRQGAEKWKRRSQAATQDYLEGVRNPRKQWQAETEKAEPAYQEGVQAAITRKSFGKGVRKAGQAAYERGVEVKGQRRFAEGVAASGDKYEQGFAPYEKVLEGLTLTPRGRRGDPKNLERVREVADALHKERLRVLGS